MIGIAIIGSFLLVLGCWLLASWSAAKRGNWQIIPPYAPRRWWRRRK